MATTPEQRARKAAYMREWRDKNIEKERQRDREKYARRVGEGPPPRDCAWCGTTYTPKQRDGKRPSIYCSIRCKDLAKNRARQDAINATKPERVCLWCGAEIPATMRADASFCSDDCNSRAHLTTRKFRRRKGETEKRKGTPLVSKASIGDRDNWRCGICGGRINRKLKHPDPMAPSLDHIIPIARGGTDDPVNLQIAHLRCNLAKRDRPAGEQLRLV